MSWAELFDRAADCAITEGQIREQLARFRAQRATDDDGEGDPA